MTLADITIFCGIALPMTTVLAQGYRKNAIKHLNEWFERMSALDQVVKRIGHIKACQVAMM